MLYAVLFTDDDSHADARRRLMPQHLAFLEAHAAQVRAAGPLHDTADGSGAGGLWLVEAENPETVEALVAADPFWPTGLRKAVRILAWTRVFAEGRRSNAAS